jgi:tetratricopeptide (TPR) repeat protein
VFATSPEANANNIGVQLASEGKFDQAIQSFRYALRTDPEYVPGHKNLLAALVESERWPEALAAARDAEAVHPLGHYLTALTAEGAENAENDHGTTRPGGNAEQQTANGELQTASTAGIADSATDRPGDAAKPVLKAQASGLKPAARVRVPDDPEVRAALYEERDFIANCARAHLENDLLDEAEARYLLHVQLCPNEVKGYNGLAELALRRGHPDDAVRLFAISLRTYGDQPDVVAKLSEIAADARSTSSTGSGQAGSGQGDELAARVQWVLANYLEPKQQRPEMPAGVAPLKLPSRDARDWQLPIRSPEPLIELPRAPVPELPQAPVPQVPNAPTP